MRGRIHAREANATLGTLTPLEAYLVNDIELINAAHADPDVRGVRLSSTRGGDENRRSFAAMAEEAQRTEAGGSDAVVVVQQVALMSSVRPWGSHACFARASGGGPF